MHWDTAIIFLIGVPIYILLSIIVRNFAYFEAGVGLAICSIVGLVTENTGILCLAIYVSPFVVAALMKPIEVKINNKRNIILNEKLSEKQINKIGVAHELEDGLLYLFLSGRYWRISSDSIKKYHIKEQDTVKVNNVTNQIFDVVTI